MDAPFLRLSIMQLAAELLKGLYYLYYSFQHPATPVLLAGLMAMIAAYALIQFRSFVPRREFCCCYKVKRLTPIKRLIHILLTVIFNWNRHFIMNYINIPLLMWGIAEINVVENGKRHFSLRAMRKLLEFYWADLIFSTFCFVVYGIRLLLLVYKYG